jgi:zinc protease
MTRSRSFALRFLAVTVAVVALSARVALEAQPEAERARTAALDERLPMSAEVTTGTLDNGLKYFIRANAEPENRAFLRLVVDVGSVVEEADEQGVAHFLEHMAFNGTENFAKGELVERLESIGMQLGTGLNARTSFDETVYMLSVPTDAPEHIDTAMQILEDWAAAISFDPEEIELERGVVLEEWRAGQGAGSRVREQHLPVLFAGSQYAERLPIGTAESIAAIDREALLGFYRKWYRPDLMAVVAVGDFDVARIEELIRRHFAGLEPQSDEAPERPVYRVPARAETAYSIATDPELPAATVEVVHLREPPDNDVTVVDARRRLVEQLYNGLLSARFQEIAREADAPFVSAFSQATRPIRPTLSYALQAAVLQNDFDRGLSALVAELERVRRFGFTATELERGKTALLRSMESRYASRDSRPSTLFAERYTQAFLMQRPVPSIEHERALVERFVPEITLEEVNAVGRGWIDGARRVVLVTAPEKEGLLVPDEATLAASIGTAAEAELAPYVDRGAGEALLDAPPVGSAVVAERARDAGITEWELANGVRVVLKPTDFNDDQIVFRGVFAGGFSLAEDADLVAAQTAVPVIAASGLGEHDATALQKLLTGKAAAANVFVSEYETGVAGQASPKDLQALFELIYLRFTAPRADANAFATVQNQIRLSLANRDSNPAVAFNDAFNRLMTQGHPRARPLTVASLDEMSLERSQAFYRDRFSNPAGATFVFVGAFSLDAMRPLVERYLGGLPTSGEPQQWRDRGVRPPQGKIEETVHKGIEPRSQTRIAFPSSIDMDDIRQSMAVVATVALLQNRLRDAVREQLGGTYNVGVRTALSFVPVENATLIIEFGSDPQRADELTQRIFAEIATLQNEGPTADNVATVREGLLRQYETNSRQNGAWLAPLSASYLYEKDPGPASYLAVPGIWESLTPALLRDTLVRHADLENYVRVTLLPQP